MSQAYYEKRYSFSTHCFYGIEHGKNILFLCGVDSAVIKYFNPCVLSNGLRDLCAIGAAIY